MPSIQNFSEAIIEKFDEASVLTSAKFSLEAFLIEVRDIALNELAGDVATTLLGNLQRYSTAYCSEKQAYVIARIAIENGIQL